MDTRDFMTILETVGIPAAFAVAAGWMVWKLFSALIDRVRQMDNDMIRIDSMVRTALGVQIDVDRLARADGKKDQRKD